MLHLLVDFCLPFQCGKAVVGLIRTVPGRQEPNAGIVFQASFHRLTVFAVQRREEERQGRNDQQQHRSIAAQWLAGQQIDRNRYDCRKAETHKLAAGQAEHDLVLHLRQILWDSNFRQNQFLLLVGVQNALCNAAGLE